MHILLFLCSIIVCSMLYLLNLQDWGVRLKINRLSCSQLLSEVYHIHVVSLTATWYTTCISLNPFLSVWFDLIGVSHLYCYGLGAFTMSWKATLCNISCGVVYHCGTISPQNIWICMTYHLPL